MTYAGFLQLVDLVATRAELLAFMVRDNGPAEEIEKLQQRLEDAKEGLLMWAASRELK